MPAHQLPELRNGKEAFHAERDDSSHVVHPKKAITNRGIKFAEVAHKHQSRLPILYSQRSSVLE